MENQQFGNRDRLSIEIDCPPGPIRPNSVFESILKKIGMTTDDFIQRSESPVFGEQEWLVKPEKIDVYLSHKKTVKKLLTEAYKSGVVRFASW